VEPLTDMERDVYEYLVDYLREHTYQPSVREIGGRFGIKSTKTVAAHLQALAEKGWVERDPSRSRGVRLLATRLFPDTIEVRSFRSMTEEGDPFTDDLCDGSFYLDRGFAGCDDAFLYPMGGDSLSEDGILDGDRLLVAPAAEPDVRPGDLVLARVDRRGVVRRFGPGSSNGDSAHTRPASVVGAATGAGPGGHARVSGTDWQGQIIGRVVGVWRPVASADPVD
jgi:repressor LexA